MHNGWADLPFPTTHPQWVPANHFWCGYFTACPDKPPESLA
jgi:hypothetical protein